MNEPVWETTKWLILILIKKYVRHGPTSIPQANKDKTSLEERERKTKMKNMSSLRSYEPTPNRNGPSEQISLLLLLHLFFRLCHHIRVSLRLIKTIRQQKLFRLFSLSLFRLVPSIDAQAIRRELVNCPVQERIAWMEMAKCLADDTAALTVRCRMLNNYELRVSIAGQIEKYHKNLPKW